MRKITLACGDNIIEIGGAPDFAEMIHDWQADKAPEYDDLEIGDPEASEDGKWVAYAHDDKNTYELSDDGNGNITIHYIGTRTDLSRPARIKAGEREKKMSKISLDNGLRYMTAQEAMPEIDHRTLWSAVVSMMDNGTREAVHADVAPCTEAEFLAAYLERASDDLVLS